MKTYNKAITAVVSALVLATALPAAAQEPRSISYADAINIALEKSTAVLLAQNSAELSATEVSQSKRAFLPDLRLTTSAGHSVGRTFSEGEGSIVNTTSQSLNAGVSSSITLFDGFRNVANLKAAQLSEDVADLTLERAQQTAAFTVSAQFLALIEGDEQLKVQREALAAQEIEERQIKALVDAGARPIADLYQQQASVAASKAALVNAQRNWGQAKLDLVETLQLDPAAEYNFSAPAINTNARGLDSVNVLITRALANRNDLRAQATQVEVAEQGVRAANASRLPTVSVGAGYNTGASSVSELSISDQLDERRGGSVSLSVSIPLFDKNASTAAQQAKIQADNAGIQLAAQKSAVAVEVRKAYLDYESAQEQLAAAEAQLKAAELALTATRERYSAGVSTLVEVTQARAAQVQAASAVVNARYGLALQRTLIDYYTGELNPQNAMLG